jgi:class 3 adenylate cyclase
MALLRDYHSALGPIVARYEGTLDKYGGDGIMVFFNDPLPTPDPAKRAVELAVAMREAAAGGQGLASARPRCRLCVGISQGYATLGQIGFAERMDYTAIGTVTNLAARLCSEAKDGQILISRRVAIAVEDTARLEEIGEVTLKGLSQAVAVFNGGDIIQCRVAGRRDWGSFAGFSLPEAAMQFRCLWIDDPADRLSRARPAITRMVALGMERHWSAGSA